MCPRSRRCLRHPRAPGRVGRLSPGAQQGNGQDSPVTPLGAAHAAHHTLLTARPALPEGDASLGHRGATARLQPHPLRCPRSKAAQFRVCGAPRSSQDTAPAPAWVDFTPGTCFPESPPALAAPDCWCCECGLRSCLVLWRWELLVWEEREMWRAGPTS